MRMHNFTRSALVVGLLAATSACTFYARGPEQYRDDTQVVLETRGDQIKECYDVALTTNDTVKGDVVVNFTVEKKTGKFMSMQLDETKTTAPKELADCIINSIDGLMLEPQDQRDGLATFTWSLKVGKPNA